MFVLQSELRVRWRSGPGALYQELVNLCWTVSICDSNAQRMSEMDCLGQCSEAKQLLLRKRFR